MKGVEHEIILCGVIPFHNLLEINLVLPVLVLTANNSLKEKCENGEMDGDGWVRACLYKLAERPLDFGVSVVSLGVGGGARGILIVGFERTEQWK